jgi:hypothetical protein
MGNRSYNKIIAESFLEEYEEKMKDPNFEKSEYRGVNNLGGIRFTLKYIWDWILEFRGFIFAFLFNIAFIATAITIGLPYESLGGIALTLALMVGVGAIIVSATYDYFKGRMRIVNAIRKVFPSSTKRQALHIAHLIREARAKDRNYWELAVYIKKHDIPMVKNKTPKKLESVSTVNFTTASTKENNE